VIGGYSEPAGTRSGFGALLVGVDEADAGLHFAGRVGSGFDDATLRRLAPRLRSAERRTSPFRDGPSAARRAVCTG